MEILSETSVRKLYIIGPPDGGGGCYDLLADDGEFLASHFCSHRGFARGDLEAHRPERQGPWHEKYGDYQVLFLGDDDMTEAELIARNKSWYAEYEKTLPACNGHCAGLDEPVGYVDSECPRHGNPEASA